MDFLPRPSFGVEPLDIPFIADTPYVHDTDFWDFPKTHGFGDQWTALPAPRLAALAQSWLYFAAMSEFLGMSVDHGHFNSSGSVSGKPLLPLLSRWLELNAPSAYTSAPAPAPAPAPSSSASAPLRSRSRSPKSEAAARDKVDLRQLLDHRARFLDDVFHLAEDFEKLSQGRTRPIPAIILSVKILCVTLHGVLGEVVEAQSRLDKSPARPRPWPPVGTRRLNVITPPPSPSGAAPQALPSVQLLRDVLRLRGWCPFYARKIISSYNYVMVYYFSRLFKRYSPGLSHEQCSDDKCVAGNVELAGYKPKHTESTCTCRPLSARTDKIRAILQAGGIPIIQMAWVKRKLVVKVARMTAKTRFVAISHAWSDGLGNPNANALPKCQLRRLQHFVDKLEPLARNTHAESRLNILTSSPEAGFQSSRSLKPRYFWIDTLCIPVGGGPTDDIRIRAINTIPAVYQAADRVLILDSSFDDISVEGTDECERLARLSACNWTSRSWTYQEAALGSVCEVQCADSTFDPFSRQVGLPKAPAQSQTQPRPKTLSNWLSFPAAGVIKALSRRFVVAYSESRSHHSVAHADASEAIHASMIRQLAKDLGQTYSNIKPQPVVNGDGDEVPTPDLCTAFVRAWNEISRRNTTVQEDSHIILANLLGFNSRPILKLAKPEDRMSTILWSMDGIPMSLLFNKTGPRQNPAGNHRNRWVPLYPSRQRLRPGATYSNLRAIRGDLYLPNNSASRREMSVLVCTEYPEPNSTAKFSVWDASVGKRYTVEMHRQEGTLDPFAAPEVGPYCIVIQHKTDSGHTPTTMPGALFRIRRIVTNVRKWYNHNLEPEYVKSFELVEIEDAGEGRIGAKEKQKSASSELNDLGSAFARHHSGILRTVYDCPLTVSLQTEESTNGSSTKSVHEKEEKALALTPIPLPESWQVAIERDSPTFPVPLSSRPSFSEAMTPVAPYFLVTALDGLVASGCVALIIAICVTTFSLLAPLAKGVLMAKMGLHSLVLIQMFMLSGLEPRLIWDVLHLVLVALYAFSRVASGQPTALDFAFICWSLVGHGIDFAARLAIQWFVVPGLFEKYLANFDPEDGFWGQGDFLLTTTWYGRILARLGRKSGQDRAGQILGEVPEHWRSEQHLLGNMEG